MGMLHEPTVLAALERLWLQQEETNALLRQILVPLAFISGCCTAAMDQLQQLTASCSLVTRILQEASASLGVLKHHTAALASLAFGAATAAAQEDLLAAHAAHAARGMHLAEAACLIAGMAIGLPYRWRACAVQHSPPTPARPWELWLPSGLWSKGPPGQGGAASGGRGASGSRSWGWSLLAAAVYGSGNKNVFGGASKAGSGGPDRAAAAAGAWPWLGPARGVRTGSKGSSWIGYGSGSGSPSVPLCRAAVTGWYILGAALLLLWMFVGLLWGLRHSYSGRARRELVARRPGRCPPGIGAADKVSVAAASVNTKGSAVSAAEQADAEERVDRMQPSSRALPYGMIMCGVYDTFGLTYTMWSCSARLVVLHTPAVVMSLASMAGSPATWLLLQLTWHAVLPYAVAAHMHVSRRVKHRPTRVEKVLRHLQALVPSWLRPLLALLWCYVAPLLVGALPALPLRWLILQLRVTHPLVLSAAAAVITTAICATSSSGNPLRSRAMERQLADGVQAAKTGPPSQALQPLFSPATGATADITQQREARRADDRQISEGTQQAAKRPTFVVPTAQVSRPAACATTLTADLPYSAAKRILAEALAADERLAARWPWGLQGETANLQ